MPTYEYICSKCDHQFDISQPITDKPLTVCPKDRCAQKRWGKGPVKRAIGGGGGLIFKGSGFYITDYRSDSYKEGAKKESGTTATPTSGENKPSPAKSDTKSAPKTETKPAKPKAEK